MLIDQPRKLILHGVEFTEADIKVLQGVFPKMDMAVVDKREARSSVVLRKALEAGAVLCHNVETKNKVISLHLSQDGRSLLGKV